MRDRLALHTWTLDRTPLPGVLAAARQGGWNAVELRPADFARAREAGRPAEWVIEEVGRAGLPVACVGLPWGWMFAQAAERGRLLAGIRDCCRWASALGVPVVMSPVDFTDGPLDRAAASLVEVGDIVAGHGLRLALELQSQAPRFNTVERTREVVQRAGHAACGLLLDTYHVERSGGWAAVEALDPHEILYVQYSDVPAAPRPGFVLDRLPPGRGTVRWPEVFALLDRKGYQGWLSYEAPHEAAWARDAVEVAREAAEATRAFLPA